MHSPLPDYAELHCLSSFSFQRGASLPEELVVRAAALGYTALAITDECSVAGVVRAHTQAKELGLKLLLGAEFRLSEPQLTLVLLAHSLQGWGNLCEFITAARSRALKGSYEISWCASDFALLEDCEVLLVAPRGLSFEALCTHAMHLKKIFGPRLWIALELLHGRSDELWQHKLERVSQFTGVPLVAAGGVQMHVRSRKPLHDVLAAIGLGRPVADCGFALQPNAEAHLRTRLRLAQLYPPQLLANTLVVAARCHFSLDELRYQYPMESVLPGLSPSQTLHQYTHEGAARRYPQGLPPGVAQQVAYELALIAELRYEMYFLTVHDIVRFARGQGILCQGRGSAANSAVCYCLGVTEVDPAHSSLLFERFISRARNEPPDIDVDFEHERREEVIQYIYARYGRERAALTATVVSYRPRSALRDVGRALGVDEALIDRLAKSHHWFDGRSINDEEFAQAGLDPLDRQLALWRSLVAQLLGFPRHLSQHVGGFVLTQGKLTRLVPVENAAMPERSIIQWDKDDLDAMGLLKVDVLALGMLSAIRRCLALVGQRRGRLLRLQDIPANDAATYDMVCAADTVGVFQIESRAQMSMLPRLRPRCFYDLVIEVAIVRPGPIQGGMVHPYLRRRQGLEPVDFPPALAPALARTLGVPIFQEQVMQIAMLAADFSPDEADALRRSMAAWKRRGGVHKFHDLLVQRMQAKGYSAEYAEGIFSQIVGFGEYGFPESHAASFAQLVYVSAWLKRHEPACFLAALINSQPMGFYAPSQLVQDAQRHGITVLPADVSHSDWDCTINQLNQLGSDSNYFSPDPVGRAKELESDPNCYSVRLGLCLVAGLPRAVGERLVVARGAAAFASVEDLALRAGLDRGDLRALATADALASLAGHRRQQVWDASALQPAPPLLQGVRVQEPRLLLPAAAEGQEVLLDYASTGLTLRAHPLSLLRSSLSKMKLMTAAELHSLPDGRLVRACGLVTMRQQPGTAKGVMFVTLEDETGSINVIVWKSLRERQRAAAVQSRLLAVHGVWQRDSESGGEVRHLIAGHLRDLTPLLGGLAAPSREFH